MDDEGKEIKIRGKKNVATYFRDHLDEWRKLYDKVYAKLSQKDDPSILAFESMLNIDLSEKIGVDITTTNLEDI